MGIDSPKSERGNAGGFIGRRPKLQVCCRSRKGAEPLCRGASRRFENDRVGLPALSRGKAEGGRRGCDVDRTGPHEPLVGGRSGSGIAVKGGWSEEYPFSLPSPLLEKAESRSRHAEVVRGSKSPGEALAGSQPDFHAEPTPGLDLEIKGRRRRDDRGGEAGQVKPPGARLEV